MAWEGAIAQLVERLVRNEKVRGSTPLSSTILPWPASIFTVVVWEFSTCTRPPLMAQALRFTSNESRSSYAGRNQTAEAALTDDKTSKGGKQLKGCILASIGNWQISFDWQILSGVALTSLKGMHRFTRWRLQERRFRHYKHGRFSNAWRPQCYPTALNLKSSRQPLVKFPLLMGLSTCDEGNTEKEGKSLSKKTLMVLWLNTKLRCTVGTNTGSISLA